MIEENKKTKVVERQDEGKNHNTWLFTATFNARDVLLYALSIGFGGNNTKNAKASNADDPFEQSHLLCTDDLQQDEHIEQDEAEKNTLASTHPDFIAIAPTFCLALYFVATLSHNKSVSASEDVAVDVDVNADVLHDRSSFECLQTFPPPILRHPGIIPRELLLLFQDEGINESQERRRWLQQFPVLHVRQRVVWKKEWYTAFRERGGGDLNNDPSPRQRRRDQRYRRVTLTSRVVAVIPKSTGTFVTSIATLYNGGNSRRCRRRRMLCEMESTFLVLGMDPNRVRPYQDRAAIPTTKKQPTRVTATRNTRSSSCHSCTWDAGIYLNGNTTHLYRLASGDMNRIHVLGTAATGSPQRQSLPIVHGLCTLGHVARLLQQHYSRRTRRRRMTTKTSSSSTMYYLYNDNDSDVQFQSIDCQFVQSIHLSREKETTTRLLLQVWEEKEEEVEDNAHIIGNSTFDHTFHTTRLIHVSFEVVVVEPREEEKDTTTTCTITTSTTTITKGAQSPPPPLHRAKAAVRGSAVLECTTTPQSRCRSHSLLRTHRPLLSSRL